MNIEEMLEQTGAVSAISRELGVDPATARAGAAELLPSLLTRFQNPARPEAAAQGALSGMGGLGGLLATIGGLGGAGLLDNVTSSQPTEVEKGNEILGQLLGSKDASRAVAAEASAQSGIEPSLLKKMLPILAMLAAGYVMKQAGQGQGGLGGMIGGVLAEPTATTEQTRSSEADRTSGGLLDDLIGAAGKFLNR